MKKIIFIGLILALCLLSVPVAAAIEFQSSTNASSESSSTLTIPKPSGVAPGDFLLAQITFDRENAGNADINGFPDGWNLVLLTNNGNRLGQAIYYKVATSSEPPSYSWTFTQGLNSLGVILRYTCVNTTNPIIASSGATGNSDTLTATSVTAEANSMLVGFYGMWDDRTLSVPSGMVARNGSLVNFGSEADLSNLAVDQAVGAGSTDTKVSTASGSARWVAQLVALRPGCTGSISGYKNDTAGNRLNSWNITLRNTTTLSPVYFNITHTEAGFGVGYYNITGVPYGTYWLNETPQAGWNQITLNRTVQINASTPRLFNQNFTNSLLGNISGYKLYPNGTGIGGWQITLNNQTNAISLTCTTASNGYYIFQNLPLYFYQLNETLLAGWTQWPNTPNRTVQINATNRTLANQSFINKICPPPPPPPPEGNLTITKTVYPENINLSGSSCFVQNTTVTISITGYGCGNPACVATPLEDVAKKSLIFVAVPFAHRAKFVICSRDKIEALS